MVEPTRLILVASELLSTLEYLKRQWEISGRIDAINMIHVYEAIALAKASEGERSQPKGRVMADEQASTYVWRDMADVPKDEPVILYFSVGSCRVPYVARYSEGHLDRHGVMNWQTIEPIPGDTPTGWLPIVWKD